MIITKPDYYPEVTARDEQGIMALTVDLKPDETVHIGKLDVGRAENCLNWKRGGKLIIDEIFSHHFSEDNVQARTSNLTIGKMRWADLLPTCSKRHPDRILQAYAVKADGYTLDPNGLIENIEIRDIVGKMLQRIDQGVMLSERNRHADFYIGNDRFEVEMAGYEWAISLGTAENSVFGGNNVITNGGVFIRNRKGSEYPSKQIYVQGFDRIETYCEEETFIL